MSNKWIQLSTEEIQRIKNILEPDELFDIHIYKKLNKVDKKIKISSAKGKGRNLQYWVCERIAKLFNVQFNQQDEQCLIHSKEMGQRGVDIVFRGDIYKSFPFDIECKNTESFSLISTIEQAKTNTKEGRYWMIVHKKKALTQPIVIMEWDTFEYLWKRN
jgi:hypothetical protein